MTTFKGSTRSIHLALLLSTATALLPRTPQRLPTRLRSLRTDADAVLDLRRVDTSRSELVSPGESTISRLWDLGNVGSTPEGRPLLEAPPQVAPEHDGSVGAPGLRGVFAVVLRGARRCAFGTFPNPAAPLAPLTLISSAVALLLTLRMNLSLLRLQESRLAWGRLVLHARETAGLAATYCAAAPAEAICRHLAVLGWCLKASLRAGEDDSDVVSTMLPPATAGASARGAEATGRVTARRPRGRRRGGGRGAARCAGASLAPDATPFVERPADIGHGGHAMERTLISLGEWRVRAADDNAARVVVLRTCGASAVRRSPMASRASSTRRRAPS